VTTSIAEFASRYPKMAVKPMLIATWLGLDIEEGRLLEGLSRGALTTQQVVDAASLDPLHAWQLVTVLALSQWVTFTNAPASAAASEHSRIRGRPRPEEAEPRPPVPNPSLPAAPSVLPEPQQRPQFRPAASDSVRDDEPTVRVVGEDDPTVRVTRQTKQDNSRSLEHSARQDHRVATTRVP